MNQRFGLGVGRQPDGQVIRVDVHLAPIIHEVPVRALQRWANGPSVRRRKC